MSGLKELQKEWRDFAGALPESAGDYAAMKFELADSLQPHIEHMEALEDALRDCIEVLESVHHEVGYKCDGTRCPEGKAISKARSILGAKEEGK